MHESVSAAYIHGDKRIAPGAPLAVGGRRFKWYGIFAPGLAVPDEIETQARAFVAQADLAQAGALGFVVLHRCGADFHFLIVCSWRGNNEIWQSVHARDRDDEGFRDWPRPAPHLPTYCVWEMGAVAHESAAWRRYLLSPRDEAARAAWLEDRYEGPV